MEQESPDEKGEKTKEKSSDKPEERGEDFKFIVRMVNTDIDGEKSLLVGLTSIKGIGLRSANAILRELKIDPLQKIGTMDDETITKIEEMVINFSDHVPPWMVNRKKDWETGEDTHLVGVDVDLINRDDINRMKMIRCYRGIRHEQGQKVRGQRTKSNGRTGLQMGVIRKKSMPGQAPPKE